MPWVPCLAVLGCLRLLSRQATRKRREKGCPAQQPLGFLPTVHVVCRNYALNYSCTPPSSDGFEKLKHLVTMTQGPRPPRPRRATAPQLSANFGGLLRALHRARWLLHVLRSPDAPGETEAWAGPLRRPMCRVVGGGCLPNA